MIRHTALLMCCMLAVCACGGSDGYDIVSLPDNSNEAAADTRYRVGFRIILGDNSPDRSAATRSTPADGPYDDGRGTPYENYIDISNYRVLFFDSSNNTYITAFTPEILMPLEEDFTTSKTYQAVGSINRRLPQTVKVVMLANWPQYPDNLVEGQTTIDDICTDAASQYTYNVPFELSADSPIPLFGVKQCDGIVMKNDELTFLGTFHLLRAMAKIEVSCATEGWKPEEITLNGYATRGFCAPQGVYDEADYVKGSYHADYTDAVHTSPVWAAPAMSAAFRQLADGRFVIYVPEYRNIADANTTMQPATISVRFERPVDRIYTIRFQYYTNPPEGKAVGDAFDIMRNYYYKFSIDKTDEQSDPEITIDLFPYEVIDLDPVFGC